MNRKNWTGFFMGMVAWILMASLVQADVKVTNIEVKPRYPWNGLVDIVYSINCTERDINGQEFEVRVEFEGYDAVLDKKIPMKTMTGDGAGGTPIYSGTHTATWNAAKDYSTINSSAFQVKIHASVPLYMVVDLSGGPDATSYPVRYTGEAPNLDDDTCRTTELWLRRIPAGKFLMGSIESELGHANNETLHEVTLTKTYYIGIFEFTQKQWELITNNIPSYYKGDCRPVENISIIYIRESTGSAPSVNSLMGKLQARTGLMFDLPTEAQWEYACRAGTTTALNSGKNLTSATEDSAMNEVGRYAYNKSDGKGGAYSQHTKVGSYRPNAWGLYDMHGNVNEWCRDCYSSYGTEAVEDPFISPTSTSTYYFNHRGGNFERNADRCRSASRYSNGYYTQSWSNLGFRIFCIP